MQEEYDIRQYIGLIKDQSQKSKIGQHCKNNGTWSIFSEPGSKGHSWHTTLYLYGQPYFKKGVSEHLAYDSLVFKNTETGWQAVYGPPWLLPEYSKLDYGIYQFKLLSIGRDLLEVEVNKTNGRKAYVDRSQGGFALWPEFILSVNTVEFLDEHPQRVRIKPLDHAGELHAEFEHLQPLQVKGNWLQVALKTGDLKTIDIGWIKWLEDNRLLLGYNLLF